jgi:hypothetical protein
MRRTDNRLFQDHHQRPSPPLPDHHSAIPTSSTGCKLENQSSVQRQVLGIEKKRGMHQCLWMMGLGNQMPRLGLQSAHWSGDDSFPVRATPQRRASSVHMQIARERFTCARRPWDTCTLYREALKRVEELSTFPVISTPRPLNPIIPGNERLRPRWFQEGL